ncbi:MAG: hypothetical protein U0359_26495, partial [Byssovorax sp.]
LLPHFAALEGQSRFAEVRVGWSEQGLAVSLRVVGKKQTLWCRDTRIEDSDGIQIWIDTRDTHNVHRAGRFCHRLGLLPAGSGRQFNDPVAALLAINRARESPRPINDRLIQMRARRLEDGYSLDAAVPANALTGFDPGEHPRLGFFYTVIDRELGFQSLSLSREFPVAEDPSLWATLELTGR